MRIGKHGVGGDTNQGRALSSGAGEKGTAGRLVGKQVDQLDARSRRARSRLNARLLAVAEHDLRRAEIASGAAGEGQAARGGGDGGQSLAAETVARQSKQLVHLSQFGGRMTCERESKLIRRNSTAVIVHSDPFAPGSLDFDADPGCAGVEAVLDQLLEHGGRTFNYLAGGNL